MGNWHLCKTGHMYEVWHYDTFMLGWYDLSIGPQITRSHLGHGSVTDQQIVNAIFDELGPTVNLYYSRKGGSHYVTRDHPDVPSYARKQKVG